MLVHKWKKSSGKKDFQCHVYGTYFSRNSCLKRHFVTHTKEKLFKRDVCDKSFTLKTNVKKHMLVHTGRKYFQC